jgi:threonine aldolase
MRSLNIKRGFASDNNSGIHPKILKEIISANKGHVLGYGDDPYTMKAREIFREHLGNAAEVWFVFTGTAANTLGLSGVTRSWNSVITAHTAIFSRMNAGPLKIHRM